MYCYLDRQFQAELNKTYTELLDDFWDSNFKNILPSTIYILNAIFLLVTNCLWIRGLLKTNPRRSLPIRLNLFSGVVGLLHAVLETLRFCSMFLEPGTSCWTNSIAVNLSFTLVSMQVFLVITSSVVRYNFLVYPLTPVKDNKVYTVLVFQLVLCIGVGSMLLISSLMAIEVGGIELISYLGQAILIILTCLMDAVLIIALQRALSRATIGNKMHAERHSKAIKRLILTNALVILLNLPLVFVIFYYIFWVDENSPTQLVEMEALFKLVYILMTSYNGFMPLIHLLWNQSIKNYYSCKRNESPIQLS